MATSVLEPYKALPLAIATVAKRGEQTPLHQPYFGGAERDYLIDCIDTGWVSSVGSYVDRFERELSQTTSVPHVVATVNGTAALHAALLICGVKTNDEVLMPAFTFVATANAASQAGAIPHFVDIEDQSLGADPVALEQYLREICVFEQNLPVNKHTGRVLRALVVVHIFGHPAQLDELLEVCTKYKIVLIEDASEALGSLYKNKHVGHHGLVSTLSFNGNKIITTGGGGAVLTTNEKLAKMTKHLTTTAKVPHPWEFYHDMPAYNYRLPNLNAALGVAQLEQLPKFLKQKRDLAQKYARVFSEIKNVRFISQPAYSVSNYWLNSILLLDGDKNTRDALLNALRDEHGIFARPAWTLMHRLPMYERCPRASLTTSEYISDHLISLPSSAELGLS